MEQVYFKQIYKATYTTHCATDWEKHPAHMVFLAETYVFPAKIHMFLQIKRSIDVFLRKTTVSYIQIHILFFPVIPVIDVNKKTCLLKEIQVGLQKRKRIRDHLTKR